MAEKLTAEDVKAELALFELRKQEKRMELLARARGRRLPIVTLICLAIIGLGGLVEIYLGGGHGRSFSVWIPFIIVFVSATQQSINTRFNALIELLELDRRLPESSLSHPTIHTETHPKEIPS